MTVANPGSRRAGNANFRISIIYVPSTCPHRAHQAPAHPRRAIQAGPPGGPVRQLRREPTRPGGDSETDVYGTAIALTLCVDKNSPSKKEQWTGGSDSDLLYSPVLWNLLTTRSNHCDLWWPIIKDRSSQWKATKSGSWPLIFDANRAKNGERAEARAIAWPLNCQHEGANRAEFPEILPAASPRSDRSATRGRSSFVNDAKEHRSAGVRSTFFIVEVPFKSYTNHHLCLFRCCTLRLCHLPCHRLRASVCIQADLISMSD